MILSNTEITHRVSANQLIEPFEASSLNNTSYKIRIGEIIEPKSGNIYNGDGYFLEPAEVVIIKSKEKVKIQQDLTASYSALHTISSQGILLINASMIEAGYEGYLSCILLNFSAEPIVIYENQEIVRINFFKTSQIPQNASAIKIEENRYRNDLKRSARRYHNSFLNIKGLETKISNKVFGKVKSQIVLGSILIGILILFSTLEPLFSKWIWEKTGRIYRYEQYEVKKAIEEFKKLKEDNNNYINLQNQIDSLEQLINTENIDK
ncbi:dCTP deaminase [Saccharicrinis aurantiacus]|uniref:dCTP deaminase n=1 Tax=Saccharicrinis aurantiacus TaxID=1849719 RepID=UPI00083918E2|nr:hypothetical protein [Saccharicrinis aurantiacus]